MKNWKLGLGACLCTVGALGIILEPILGIAKLGRPWSFLLGFTVGLISGLGAALSLAGLAGMRRTDPRRDGGDRPSRRRGRSS